MKTTNFIQFAGQCHANQLLRSQIAILFLFSFLLILPIQAQEFEENAESGNFAEAKQNLSSGITLLNFSALPDDQKTQVFWHGKMHHIEGDFELLRSLDGISFELIAVIESYGSGNYVWYDRSSNEDTQVYYKLQFRDTNGDLILLGTLTLFPELDKGISLQPHPTKDKIQIQFEAGPEDQTATIQLFDPNAKLMQKQEMTVIRGLNTAELDLEYFPTGLYIIQIGMNSGTETTRVVKY